MTDALEIDETWNLHKAEKLIENDHIKILYDFNKRLRPWNHQSRHHRSWKKLKKKKERKYHLLYVANPGNRNIKVNEIDKVK